MTGDVPGHRATRTDAAADPGVAAEQAAHPGAAADPDVAAEQAADPGAAPGAGLTVAVSGASGTIGRALVPALTGAGHRVVRLVRRPSSGAGERTWDPAAPAPGLLNGVDAVVHLAGASIAGRFTERRKAAIRDSRLGPTRALAQEAARAGVATFVSASAIGYYGADRGDEPLTEDSPPGEGFLADVVVGWENAATVSGPRVVLVRTGIVQTPDGGALRLLLPLFRAGLGGPLRPGTQWQSWISIDDLVAIYRRAVVDTDLSGPVNAVAPEPVTATEYARTLGAVLHRPALVPVPALGPKLLLGSEGATEVALANQRVLPTRLLVAGHPFHHPNLRSALTALLAR